MIGGADIIFVSRGTSDEMAPLLAAIARRLWPEAVFEKDDDDYRDFFVYRDAAIRDAIEEHGILPKYDDLFFQFLVRETHFTVVVSSACNAEQPNSKKLLALIHASGFEETEWREEWRRG